MPRLQGESVEDHAYLAQLRLGVQRSEINIQLHGLLVDPLYARLLFIYIITPLVCGGDIGQFSRGR